MRALRRGRASGFTLLETTIALAIMAMGTLGALAAINNSSVELRRGQLHLAKAALADQRIQRARFAPKGTLSPSSLPPLPTDAAIGAAPWAPDRKDASPDAYFWVNAAGEIRSAVVPDEVADGTACNAVPTGMVCREVAWTTGVPGADAKMVEGNNPVTLWVRVSRNGEAPERAVVQREVFLR